MAYEELRKRFKGLIIPVVTPMSDDDKVNLGAIQEVFDYLIEGGAQGFLVCGSAGEFASLSIDERKQIVEAAVKASRGRVLIIAGVSHTHLYSVIELANHAAKVGADAALMTPPYYFKPTETEVIEYVRTVDKAIDMPLLLYNNPATTKVNLSMNAIERLTELKHFAGLKDTNSAPPRFYEELRRFGDRMIMAPAGEPNAIFNIVAGATSFMSVGANVVPQLLADIFDAASSGNVKEAFALYNKLRVYRDLFEAQVAAGIPGYITYAKAAMAMIGLPVGKPRLPLLEPGPAEKDKLRRVLKETFGLKLVA